MFWEALTTGLTGGFNILADQLSDARSRRDADTANRMAREDTARSDALQLEFAKNGVKWRVEDAERAGVHPLYALGATGASYSPTISTFSTSNLKNSTGDHIRNMGQDLSRAMYATKTQAEREAAMLQLEGMKLDNEFKRLQIHQSQAGPSFPSTNSNMSNLLIGGQGNSRPSVEEVPFRKTMSHPGAPGQQAGYVDDYALVRTARGGYAIVPSKDVAELIEDKVVPETMWAIRNNLIPAKSGGFHTLPDPKYYKLPGGADAWEWHPGWQEFQPRKIRKPQSPTYLNRYQNKLKGVQY